MTEENPAYCQGKRNGNDFCGWEIWEWMLLHLPYARPLRHEIELDVL